MTLSIRAPLCVLAAALSLSLAIGPAASAPTVHDGPSPPVEAWSKAMEAGDIKALTKMHGPDTVAFPPGAMKLKGGDAIMKNYEGLFSKFDFKVTIDEAHWIEEGPVVISWGVSTLTLHPKTGTGKDATTKTRFTDVATKIDGSWRYIVDHASVPIGN